jgi:hypothetical protein
MKWNKTKLGVRYRPITSALYRHIAFPVKQSKSPISVFSVNEAGDLTLDHKHPLHGHINEIKKKWKLIYAMAGYQIERAKLSEYIEVDKKSVKYDDLLLKIYAEPGLMDVVKPKTRELFGDIML